MTPLKQWFSHLKQRLQISTNLNGKSVDTQHGTDSVEWDFHDGNQKRRMWIPGALQFIMTREYGY